MSAKPLSEAGGETQTHCPWDIKHGGSWGQKSGFPATSRVFLKTCTDFWRKTESFLLPATVSVFFPPPH